MGGPGFGELKVKSSYWVADKDGMYTEVGTVAAGEIQSQRGNPQKVAGNLEAPRNSLF